MPETEVDKAVLEKVMDWVYEEKGGNFVRNLHPGTENGIWRIDGEPFVIYTKKVSPRPGTLAGTRPVQRYYVFCSDRHAQALEEAGILNFQEERERPE